MQCHQTLLESFPFNKMIEVPAIGNSGGIVVLWDDNFLELDEITTTSQEVHAMIKVHSFTSIWLFSCIYASSSRCNKKILWKYLRNIKTSYKGMWLIEGDFNELTSNSKKKGGNPINCSRARDFVDVINYCQFIDMGYKGSKYTWLNKRFKNKSKLILERLDRFMANDEWLQKYLDAQVYHLSRTHSDHCYLLISLKRTLII